VCRPEGRRLEGLTRGFDEFFVVRIDGQKRHGFPSMSWSKVYDGHKVLRSSLPKSGRRTGKRGQEAEREGANALFPPDPFFLDRPRLGTRIGRKIAWVQEDSRQAPLTLPLPEGEGISTEHPGVKGRCVSD